MDRLLVFADDHSAGASTAWEWVCAQQWPGWSAEVVTVVPDGASGKASPEPREWEPAVRRVPHAASRLEQVRHIQAAGDPRIIRPCDLLAMGTHGLRGWERIRVGSTADYLTHHAGTSVLLARCPDAE